MVIQPALSPQVGTWSQLSAMTFGEILLAYIAWLGERPSASKYTQLYYQYFHSSPLRDRQAHLITRYEIIYFKQQYKHTPANCSKALGMIKRAYNWALDHINPTTMQPLYDGPNPAWRVSKHDSHPRERVMDRSEIKLLLASLEFFSPKYQAFFVARLLTPCRIKELCEMRRDAVNLETGKWFKKLTKTGRPQYVLIPRQALEYLQKLPHQGEYFFMGIYDRPLSRGSAQKVWWRVRKELGMKDLWLLDFRRTLATYLYTEIKADDLTAKAVLNHYDGRPVAVYTRLNYDRLAEIIQAYADWIWQLRPKDDPQTTFTFHESHTLERSPS